jgi:hypothetical protein
VTSPDLGNAIGNNALRALVDHVWHPFAEDSPVKVTTGVAPAGHSAAETYAVVPNLARPRYLVPLGARRAAVASLWAYRTMRVPRRRASQTTVGALFRAGLGEHLFRHRLVVSIDDRLPESDRPEWLLLEHVAGELGHRRLFAGLAVRRVQPNSKPMLEVYDEDGQPRGFAKVAWSAGTNRLVRAEADALSAMAGVHRRIIVPSVLAQGRFAGNDYTVMSPLPVGLRRCTSDPLTVYDAPLEVARHATMACTALAGSAFARGHRETLSSAATAMPEVSRVLLDWLARLERDPAPIEFGRWHGDWVPHNLSRDGSRVAAWDWEHSRADVPVGFDALHWHFQQRMPSSGLAAAVGEVDTAAQRLGTFGVPPTTRHLVASLYLLEMFVRATTLAVGGGGWNPRFYPEMLEVAARRDREASGPAPLSGGR